MNNDGKKLVALTFDDGPSNVTEAVLDILQENNIPGTFFLIGEHITEESRPIMERQIAMGCELNNHSLTHSHMTELSANEIAEEIRITTEKIISVTGKAPQFFRPPFIDVNDVMYEVIDLPFICGADSLDWDSNVTADERVRNVLDAAEDGVIVLMHDFTDNYNTVEALPRIIDGLRSMGFEFVTLSKLFEIKGVDPVSDPASRGKLWSLVQ